jgi:hypothetical protein
MIKMAHKLSLVFRGITGQAISEVAAVFLALFMISAIFANSGLANAQSTQWSKSFSYSYGSGNSIIRCTDGNYVIAGESNSRFLMAKFTQFGDLLWWKTYQNGRANFVIGTLDGGFVMVGSGDVNFIQTDSSGNLQWTEAFNKNGVSFAIESAIQTLDGGYLLAGYTPAGNSPSWDWTLKIDSNGNDLWNKTYGIRSGQSLATAVVEESDGYVLAANSQLYKLDKQGVVVWNQSTALASSLVKTTDQGYLLASATGSILVKFESDGNISWSKDLAYPPNPKKMPASSPTFLHSAIQVQDGGFLAGGMAFPLYDGIAWMVKTDLAGNQEWNCASEDYTGHNCNINAIVESAPSEYILVGSISSVTNGNYKDVWIAKVSNTIPLPSSITSPNSPTASPATSPSQTQTITPMPTSGLSPKPRINPNPTQQASTNPTSTPSSASNQTYLLKFLSNTIAQAAIASFTIIIAAISTLLIYRWFKSRTAQKEK